MFTDEELLPISALQHLVFCPRRAALVFIERQWAENRYTAQGRQVHRRVHDPRRGENRPGVRIARGLELRSYRYGLVGKADVVEFHDTTPGQPPRVIVVEYKRGRPKGELDLPFRVQLCGQVLCLEEMLQQPVAGAALFFKKSNRRVEVPLDEALRRRTAEACQELHQLVRSGRTPIARYQRKCRHCSLLPLCLPKALRPRATAARYLAQAICNESSSDLPASPPSGSSQAEENPSP